MTGIIIILYMANITLTSLGFGVNLIQYSYNKAHGIPVTRQKFLLWYNGLVWLLFVALIVLAAIYWM